MEYPKTVNKSKPKKDEMTLFHYLNENMFNEFAELNDIECLKLFLIRHQLTLRGLPSAYIFFIMKVCVRLRVIPFPKLVFVTKELRVIYALLIAKHFDENALVKYNKLARELADCVNLDNIMRSAIQDLKEFSQKISTLEEPNFHVNKSDLEKISLFVLNVVVRLDSFLNKAKAK